MNEEEKLDEEIATLEQKFWELQHRVNRKYVLKNKKYERGRILSGIADLEKHLDLKEQNNE